MSIQAVSIPTVALLACAALFAKPAAAEVSLDIGLGHDRPPVVVQRTAEVGRRWIPETVVRREEKVQIPGRIERHEEKVLVEPAHIVKREERVLVEPEHFAKRPEQVLVHPATVDKQWVPPVIEEVHVGPVVVKKVVKEGFFREVTLPPVYETVVHEVKVPARHEIVTHDVEVPARYEVKVVEHPSPPRFEVVQKDVIIPGHWEEIVVTAPPVVLPPRHKGFELDIDVDKHR